MNTYYNEFFEKKQQQIHFNLYQIGLPADDSVYTIINVLEELDYSALVVRYSNKGRKGYNPIMMFAVLVYANMRGVREVDRIVDLCTRDIAFMWLTKGEKPKRDAFYNFINNKLNDEVLDDLHYQFIRILQKQGLISLETLFIDGTKIEANANRYTFVWRGTINYNLSGLLENIDNLYNRYNELIKDNGYDEKYQLSEAKMFIIEGKDHIKEVIEENRKRKVAKKKKLSNNTIIEIDNFSPIELLNLQIKLETISKGEGILFTKGSGRKKPEIQKLYEEIEVCGEKLLEYKENFEIMGTDINSYSKTDVKATFMRMKDDHMQNGQLKPAYNLQIAVENYFIVHAYVSNDRTDYNTLIPVLEKHKKVFETALKEVTADSGYCSEKNLLYLKENDISSFIKLQTHEKMKTRAYQNDISKHYNMTFIVEEDTSYYICHNRRKLEYERTEISKAGGLERTFEVFRCADCSGCPHKAKCLYQYDEEKDKDKNKVMKVNVVWEDLKAESHENIISEKGVIYRLIRSIQTEGSFGDMKENDGFRKFNYRSSEKVYKEFMLYALGRNFKKYHRFMLGKLEKYEGKAA